MNPTGESGNWEPHWEPQLGIPHLLLGVLPQHQWVKREGGMGDLSPIAFCIPRIAPLVTCSKRTRWTSGMLICSN